MSLSVYFLKRTGISKYSGSLVWYVTYPECKPSRSIQPMHARITKSGNSFRYHYVAAKALLLRSLYRGFSAFKEKTGSLDFLFFIKK